MVCLQERRLAMVCLEEERREAPLMVLGCLWRVAMVCLEERMAMVCLVECLEVELEKVMEVQGMGEDWS